MARRSRAAAVPMEWTPPSGGGRRFVALKLGGMVAAGLVVVWWWRTHPMSQIGYLVSAMLAVGVGAMLVHHRRNGRQLVRVVIEYLMVLALASVLTGGPGSQFLVPDALAKPKPAPAAKGKAEAQPARAGESPSSLADSILATCDKVAPCKAIHRAAHKAGGSNNGGALKSAIDLLNPFGGAGK